MPGTVWVNERGLRVGDSHHNAKLSDRDVELIRQLHEGGLIYASIAERFEISVSAVAKICRYERRAQVAFVERAPDRRRRNAHIPRAG